MASASIRTTFLEFEEIHIFGDSLSDTGNFFALTGGLFPASPPYFHGRFSNGPLWIDGLTDSLDLEPVNLATLFSNPLGLLDGINFALAGANTDDSNSNNSNALKPANSPSLPGLEFQVDAYGWFTDLVGARPDNALHVLWGGANDYLGGGQNDVTVTLNNIAEALDELHDDGATTFLVPNLPPLGETPLGQSLASDALNTLTTAHNQGLAALLDQFELENPDVRVIEFDVNAIFREIQAEPSAFGFATTGGCFTLAELLLDPPSAMELAACNAVFFDDLHPSAASHRLLAEAALAVLEAEFAPEQPDDIEQPDTTPLTLFGDSTSDELLGQAGDDILYGNNGPTLLVGGDGNDKIYGGDQAENISAGAGDDIIYGNGGADVIDSGAGLDEVWLGGNGDAIVTLSEGEGYDRIHNFQRGMTTLKGFTESELTLVDSADGTQILRGTDLLAIVSWQAVDGLSGAFIA